MSEPRFEIIGGADAGTAAAIAAVVAHLLDAAAQAGAAPASRPEQSPWVQASRPRSIAAPLPSHAYHPTRWVDTHGSDDS